MKSLQQFILEAAQLDYAAQKVKKQIDTVIKPKLKFFKEENDAIKSSLLDEISNILKDYDWEQDIQKGKIIFSKSGFVITINHDKLSYKIESPKPKK